MRQLNKATSRMAFERDDGSDVAGDAGVKAEQRRSDKTMSDLVQLFFRS